MTASSNDETRKQGPAAFATTRWSMVLSAGQSGAADADESLRLLCERYWFPLYAFVRRSGYDAADAQDLTQDFFAHMLSNRMLAGAHPAKGKFRSYLIACMKNLLSDSRKRANAQKRGGGCTVLSLDYEDAEGRYQLDPGHNVTPERLYEKQWAQALLQRVMGRLREESEARGKKSMFDELKVYLVNERGDVPQEELAERLGITTTNLKTRVHRLRRRYAELFREEISHTVEDPDKIDDEIRYLLDALEGGTR